MGVHHSFGAANLTERYAGLLAKFLTSKYARRSPADAGRNKYNLVSIIQQIGRCYSTFTAVNLGHSALLD